MSDPVCAYQDLCSGCQYLGISYDEQRKLKQAHLEALLRAHALEAPKSEWVSAGAFYLRDRLDFTWNQNRLGLFSQAKSEIIDLDQCLQLSLLLQQWLTEFRNFKWSFQKASFRLRVSPHGVRGVWIDAANIDIKALLEEKNTLHELSQNAIVEIGQRRKIAKFKDNEWKLKDPEFHPWFQSWHQDRPVDLYCQVASFTQPSLQANRLIAQHLRSWMQEIGPQRILEFGSGIGNLSFPMLEFAKSYTACEIDSLAVEGFKRSLQKQDLSSEVELLVGDFQKNQNVDFSRFDLALCNPPRSGIKDFVLPILEEPVKAPPYLVYMSCFPESLAQDLARLKNLNYDIQKIAIVDQFPQTEHYEVLTLLQRK